MAEHFLVMPFREQMRPFNGIVAVLDDGFSFRRIRDEHFAAISRKYPRYTGSIDGGSYCLLYESGEAEPNQNNIERYISCANFSVNMMIDGDFASLGTSFLLRKKREFSVIKAFGDADSDFRPSKKVFFDKEKTPEEFQIIFKHTKLALEKRPKFGVSIRRFASALSRSAPEEKVIDMCICLESIFDSQNEISFRFSLYNAYLIQQDSERRIENFKILRDLYAIRSKIVHGSEKFDQAWFDANWEHVVKIAKLSLLHKISYLSDHKPSEWGNYLDNLALGGARDE